ncbi:MAG TPA: HD domain-containing protein [Anaerolineales bacterium]|nr:HD domain-containing protein [Anaerolineales bacterium]
MKTDQFEQLVEKATLEAKVLIERQKRFSEPFRNRFEHTKRVLAWARRIQAIEGGDIEIITLSVIFHDAGWDGQVDHALLGAELARNFLVEQGVEVDIVNRVASAIETHNKRQNLSTNLPLENLIVMDADRLDELGVTSLVWDAMAIALEDAPSFKKTLNRGQQFFTSAKEAMQFIHTKTGLKFYAERIKVWEQCLNQLRYELGESDIVDPILPALD